MQIKNLTDLFRPVDNADNRTQKNKAGRSSQGDSSTRGDRVSLSKAAQQYKQTQQAAQDSPGVRAEKVGHIRGQVADGTYQMDSRKTAEKILEQEFVLWGRKE
jgi:flagellar biosynthesis anti-sigma factor FlgM